jgi:hypothetical protein
VCAHSGNLRISAIVLISPHASRTVVCVCVCMCVCVCIRVCVILIVSQCLTFLLFIKILRIPTVSHSLSIYSIYA